MSSTSPAPSTHWPSHLQARQVRVARPTDQLENVIRFYHDGLGLNELYRFDDHDGYTGVMLGLPGAEYHLEFTTHQDGSPGTAPTRDNLLVLYLDDEQATCAVAQRLEALGHPAVEPENPFWRENGAITIEDPDGWRVVLMPTPAF